MNEDGHRVILASDAYARASRHPEHARTAEKDPQGVLYAAFTPRRLTAEQLLDAEMRREIVRRIVRGNDDDVRRFEHAQRELRIVAIPVEEARDKLDIRPGTLYVATPGYHLSIERERCFSLSQEDPVHFSRPSIDVFLESAADAYGANLAALLLTGASVAAFVLRPRFFWRMGLRGLYFERSGNFRNALIEFQAAARLDAAVAAELAQLTLPYALP